MADSIEKQLKSLIKPKTKLSNGKTIAEYLKEAVDCLYQCLQDEIDFYYDSYEPTMYERTYALRKSFRAEDIVDIRVKGKSFYLSVVSTPDAWQWNLPAVVDPVTYRTYKLKRHKTFAPAMVARGWDSVGLASLVGNIYYLTWFEGYDFISEAIDEFNKKNKWGVNVYIEKNITNYIK